MGSIGLPLVDAGKTGGLVHEGWERPEAGA